MAKATIGKDGVVLIDGKPLEISGEPVTIQEDFDAKLKDRIEKEKAKREELAEQVKALEAQANKTAETERLLAKAKDDLAASEKRLEKAKAEAQEEVANQLAALAKERDQFKARLGETEKAWLRDQVSAQILSASGDLFINPARDIVPALLGVHKREPKTGTDGKPVEGQFVDLFEVEVANEKGEVERKALPASEAVKALAMREDHAHYVRSQARGGSGSGGSQFHNIAGLKRSTMNASDKSAFIAKHGADAFKKLPE